MSPRRNPFSQGRTMKVDPDTMQAAADYAGDLLKMLANRHRLMILCMLMEGEKSVGQLVELLGARDSTVSQNLATLRRCGLISGRRDGRRIWYRVESSPARGVLEALYNSLCEPPPQLPKARPLTAPLSRWSAALRA